MSEAPRRSASTCGIIAATNRNPEQAVRSGQLREDLYYRLNVFPIAVPPLRTRPEDVEALALHFLSELNRGAGSAKRWTTAALERLKQSQWPGNVRELRNVVQRAFILCDDEITADALPAAQAAPFLAAATPILQLRLGGSIAAAEKRVILATLEMEGGDKRKTAAVLGISLKTLYNRLGIYRGVSGDAE